MVDREKEHELPSGEDADGDDTGWGVAKWTMIAGGGLAAIILLILVAGFVLAIVGNPDETANRVRLVRDIFIIALALEMLLIIAALTILIIQVAGLVNLLQNEIKPILKNARETLDTAKGSAEFVGANVAQPIMRAAAFMAGATVFLREVGGIRRALRRTTKPEKEKLPEKESEA